MEQLVQDLVENPQARQDLQGFVQRYETGHPSQGYSDQEVAQHYNQIAPRLPQQQYESAARAAYGRLTPQERQQFGQWLKQQTYRGRGGQTRFGQALAQANDQKLQDPGFLSEITGMVHQEQPGLLGELLGQSSGGSNPVVRAALAGITAIAAKKLLGQ